jgi:hypothetical protein
MEGVAATSSPFLSKERKMVKPLVTLEDYKTYKKIAKSDMDNELNFIIDSVNTLVKTFVGHSIVDYYDTPAIETFNIKADQTFIQLNEWPIKEIISLESRIALDQPYTTLGSAEYYVDTKISSIYSNSAFDEGLGAVKVTYKAGFDEVPTDVRLAALDLVHYYYKEEYKEKRQIGSISIDNTSKYNISINGWPNHIVRVLDMYRNV